MSSDVGGLKAVGDDCIMEEGRVYLSRIYKEGG